MKENIIEIENVRKLFDTKTVLDNISLNIKKGEFVTILGLKVVVRQHCYAS